MLTKTESHPFIDHKELYETIDSTLLGDVHWDSFQLRYSGEQPAENVPPWMNQPYKFWYRPTHTLVASILSNTDFHGEFDYIPFRDFSVDNHQHCYQNFMSGDWAWLQAVRCALA